MELSQTAIAAMANGFKGHQLHLFLLTRKLVNGSTRKLIS